MVLCRADPGRRPGPIIARNVEWLEETQIKSGPADRKGGWSYGAMPSERSLPATARTASSRCWPCTRPAARPKPSQIHVTIHRETWERVRSYWINNQREDDGSWGYYKPMDGTGSMTCAGIASLVIAGDVLHEPDAKVTGDQIDGCYRAPSEDQDRIDRGIDWLRRHFTVQANPPSSRRRQPSLALLLSLRAGARRPAHRPAQDRRARLVSRRGRLPGPGHRHRRPRSSWKGSGHAEDNEDIATSLALLFLSKGRWPVLMAKVQYRSPTARRGGKRHRLEPPPQRRQQPDDLRRVASGSGN